MPKARAVTVVEETTEVVTDDYKEQLDALRAVLRDLDNASKNVDAIDTDAVRNAKERLTQKCREPADFLTDALIKLGERNNELLSENEEMKRQLENVQDKLK